MKNLGFYNYAPAILENWDEFKIFDFEDKEKFNKPCLFFRWEFKQYKGHGDIYYYPENHKVRNEFGDNDSIMNIDYPDFRDLDESKVKHYSPLYNEPRLEEVFNKILKIYFKD